MKNWRIALGSSIAICLVLLLSALTTARNATTPQQLDSKLKPVRSYWADKHNAPRLDSFDRQTPSNAPVHSPSMLDDRRRPPVGLAAQAQASPGLIVCGSGALGGTSWDYQVNDDNQQMIAVLPSGGTYAHFAWTHWDRIPDSLDGLDHYVAYSTYSQAAGLPLGQCGFTLNVSDPSNAKAAYPSLDVQTGDKGNYAFNARSESEQITNPPGPKSVWLLQQAAPGFNIFGEEEFPASTEPEANWPHLRVDVGGSSSRAPGDDVFHICAHPTGDYSPFDNEIFYWRRIGGIGNVWEGPVVLDYSADEPLSFHVAVDPTSEKVAVFYETSDADGLLDVGYLESADNGANWIAAGGFPTPIEPTVGPYVKIADYSGFQNLDPQAWLECHGEYDPFGVKHCVWIEQVYSDLSNDCRLQHWDELNGTKTIEQAIGWGNAGDVGMRDLWLAQPNLAFGNNSSYTCNGVSSQDFVYVSFEQYGGPTTAEATDASAAGFQNLELYLSISQNSGASFSRPENLTQTQTPGCDGTSGNECASERDPSLAHVVNDTLHLLYFVDTDAGDAPFGQGSWTFNPVMYYRIPCKNDDPICCPEIAPAVAAFVDVVTPECTFDTPCGIPDTVDAELLIENQGNAPLNISAISVPAAPAWLSIAASPPYIVNPAETVALPVTMDGSVVGCGNYAATIEIAHDDPGTASPIQVGVEFVNGPPQCLCPFQGDMNADGVLDAEDLNDLIDALFFGAANPQDPCCSTPRADFNNDSVTDAIDLNALIEHLFFGGSAPVAPCE